MTRLMVYEMMNDGFWSCELWFKVSEIDGLGGMNAHQFAPV